MEMPWEVAQILEDSQLNDSTVIVFVARIQPKHASTLIRKLNRCAPLTSLSHVKRVRKLSIEDGHELLIILCLASWGTFEWSSCEAPSEVIELVEEHKLMPFVTTVSQHEACSRNEWEQQCHLWPTLYHPNAVKCRLGEVESFKEDEVQEICKFMRAAIRQAKCAAKCGQPPNGAVIVDPVEGCVVSAGHDETGEWKNNIGLKGTKLEHVDVCTCTKGKEHSQLSEEKPYSWHPLRHAVMVAVQRAVENLCMDGVNESSQGHSNTTNLEHRRTRELVDNIERPGNAVEQYLCTGLDAYVTREPCSMCAMALLHQRVRRVFYGISNRQVGALGGVHKLHLQQGINHHYLVFQVSLCEEDLL